MTAYVDSSVILRVVLGSPNRLAEWERLARPVASRLVRVECLRTLDRSHQQRLLAAADLSARRGLAIKIFEAFHLVELTADLLSRVEAPFPTPLRTLDAIHVASAVAWREVHGDLFFATHDREQALGAQALGFRIMGFP